MAMVSGNAPWYEKSGLIRIPTYKSEVLEYGVNAASCVIPLPFNFPIGSDSVKYISYMWGIIYFKPQNTRVKWGSDYEEKTWILEVKSKSYGFMGEHLYYETTPNYARILSVTHLSGGTYVQYEFIFFKNGNIQIKCSGNNIGYVSSETNNGYTNLYYQDKTSTAEGATAENHYLVNDTVCMEDGESILIVRNSSTSYTVNHNSYWQNDTTYTIPLRGRILGDIIHFKDPDDTNTSDFSNSGGFYSIPIYSPSAYNTALRINTPTGIGCIRTQSPVTPNLVNPPAYVQIGGNKLQLSCGFSPTKEKVYHVVDNSWGNLNGNMYPRNTTTYYWINPGYRYFKEPVSNVTGIYLRCGVNSSESTHAGNTLYIYYSDKNTDGLTSSSFTYLDTITTTGYDGEYYEFNTTFSSRKIGAIIILQNITGGNASSSNFFAYEIAVQIPEGLKLL